MAQLPLARPKHNAVIPAEQRCAQRSRESRDPYALYSLVSQGL
jgi:hypothetical protein